MSALESLSNPLERLQTLPTAVQARGAAGDITWDAALQYYRGDLAISGITGGAYIFTGGAQERSAILGGVDPALDLTGLWTRLAANGVSSVEVFDGAGPYASAGAGAAYTFPAGASILAPEGSTWMCVVQGTNNSGAKTVGTDFSTFTFNANGVGAVDAVVSPLVAGTASTFSATATVFVGVGGSSITFTGVAAGIAQSLAGVRVSYIRLA